MKREYLYALLAVLAWGTLAPVSKLMIGEMGEVEMLFTVSLIATVSLLAVCLVKGRIKTILSYGFKSYAVMSLLGVLGIFIYNAAYLYGIAHLSAQEACIINYLWPIMTVIFSCFILKESFTPRTLAAICISFFGIVVIVTQGKLSSIGIGDMRGVAACITAAVAYGCFSALNKKYGYDQLVAMTVYYGVCTICTGAWLCFLQPTNIGCTPIIIGGLLWLGIAVNAFAYLLWAIALKCGETAKISNLAYITPFMSIIFSRLILGEKINIFALLGLVFIIVGIFVQINPKWRINGRKQE
jgi:drug/metabolite transporter (DMT)-like permease